MTRGSCLGEKCDNILTLSDFSTLPHLWEVWNYVKNDEGFVRLGEKWAITVTLLDYSLPPQRLHTSEKCGTKQGGKKLWISWSGLDMAIFKSLNSLISRYFLVAKIWKGSMTQTGIRRKRAISRALTIHGKSGNSGENSNGTVHPGGNFPPKKSNTSWGITFFTFLPKRPKFLVPFVWLTSARLHLEEEGEKWRSFPRRVTAFCIWYNFNPFLFSETFSSLETFVGHFLPKFPWKW